MKYTVRKNCFETNSSSMHSIVITKNKDSLEIIDAENDLYEDSRYHYYIEYTEDELSFGRYPFNLLTTWDEKLAYYLASYCSVYVANGYDFEDKYAKAIETKKMLEDIVKKHIVNLPNNLTTDDISFEIKLPTTELIQYKNPFTGELIPPKYLTFWTEDENGDRQYTKHPKFKDTNGKFEFAEEAHDNDSTKPWIKEYYNFGDVDHQSYGRLQNFLGNKIIAEEFIFSPKYIVVIDGDEYEEFDKLRASGIFDNAYILWDGYVNSKEDEEYETETKETAKED